jgi:hypothetical protein
LIDAKGKKIGLRERRERYDRKWMKRLSLFFNQKMKECLLVGLSAFGKFYGVYIRLEESEKLRKN